MKTIEHIKATFASGEQGDTPTFQNNTLTFTTGDGKSHTITLYGNGRNADYMHAALDAESTRNLHLARLESTSTPEEAAETIKQALAAQATYNDTALEIRMSIDAPSQAKIDKACKKHGLDYKTLQDEADDVEFVSLARVEEAK